MATELYLRGLQVNQLPDIAAVNQMNPSDRACLDEIRAVLQRYELTEKFGVALLHKHFDLTDDEVLVEQCDVDRRMLVASPAKRSEVDVATSVTTLWKFSSVATDGDSAKECTKYCPMDGDKHRGYKDHG